MDAVFWPIVGLLFVGCLPGLLVERILLPGRPVLDRLALAPALSCSTVFLFFRLAGMASVSVSPAAFLVLLAGLTALAIAPRKRGRAPQDTSAKRSGRWTLEKTFSAGMLVVAIVVGGAIWLQGIPDHLSVPPNYDSMYHGFMAGRIAATGSLDTSRVLVTDLRSGEAVTAFYPLGLHVIAALVHRMTGSNLSDVLWWIVVLAGAVCLPIGTFSLTRRFFPEDPLVPGVAAVLSVLMPLFPYKPIAWGGIALILGMALTAGVVVALRDCIGANWSFRAVILGLLALVGILVIHTSEIPLAVLLIGTLVLHQATLKTWWPFVRTSALQLAGVGAAFALVALPLAGRAMQDRSLPDNPYLPLSTAFSEIAQLRVSVDVGQIRVALLATAGIAALLWRRRPWLVVAFGLIVALYAVAASSANHTLRTLTSPWYRQSERLAYVIAWMAAILAAVGVASVAEALRRRCTGHWAPVLAVIVAAGLMLASALHLPALTSAMIGRQISAYSAVGPDELAVFRFVERQGTPLAVLGDELGDGSIWMYPLAGVTPVFAMKPPSNSPLWKTWQERLFVAQHLNDPTVRPDVEGLLAKYCIGFVYYSDRHLYGATGVFSLEALQKNTQLREDFRSGDARIFRVKNARCTQAAELRGDRG